MLACGQRRINKIYSSLVELLRAQFCSTGLHHQAVHEKSHLDTHLPELTGLWVVPPTQMDVNGTYHELVEAKGDLDHANTLTFETGAERDFIDMSDSHVELKFQVVSYAGKITDAINLALSNLCVHGLF